MAELVTDPALLAKLNAPQPVTDPDLLARLNAPEAKQSWWSMEPTSGQRAVADVYKDVGENSSFTPQEQEFSRTVGAELLKGVPVAGGFVPQSADMSRFEREYPKTAAGLNLGGGVASVSAAAPAIAAGAPAWLANAPRAVQALYSALGFGGLAAGDTATRDAMAPATGQNPGDPATLMKWAHLGSTGSRPLDAAITAAAISPVATVAGKTAAYFAPETKASAEALRRQNVTLSPGQRTGGDLEELERIGSALPLAHMEGIRSQGIPSFNRAAEDMALKQLDIPEFNGAVRTSLPDSVTPGFAGRDAVYRETQKAYNRAFYGGPRVPRIDANDAAMEASLTGRITNNYPDLTPQTRQRFTGFVRDRILPRFEPLSPPPGAWGTPYHNVSLSGPALGQIKEELGDAVSRATAEGGEGHTLARMYGSARDELFKEFSSQNPANGKMLDAADNAYSHWAELRAAGANASKDLNGQFTPEQLAQGSKTADISFKKRATSLGETRYGDLARNAIDAGVSPTKPVSLMTKAEMGGLQAVTGAKSLLATATGRLYSTPEAQALTHAYLSALAPVVRPTVSTALPRAAVMSTFPAQHQAVIDALMGDQQ